MIDAEKQTRSRVITLSAILSGKEFVQEFGSVIASGPIRSLNWTPGTHYRLTIGLKGGQLVSFEIADGDVLGCDYRPTFSEEMLMYIQQQQQRHFSSTYVLLTMNKG